MCILLKNRGESILKKNVFVKFFLSQSLEVNAVIHVRAICKKKWPKCIKFTDYGTSNRIPVVSAI